MSNIKFSLSLDDFNFLRKIIINDKRMRGLLYTKMLTRKQCQNHKKEFSTLDFSQNRRYTVKQHILSTYNFVAKANTKRISSSLPHRNSQSISLNFSLQK